VSATWKDAKAREGEMDWKIIIGLLLLATLLFAIFAGTSRKDK
jgi:hypothetical protein